MYYRAQYFFAWLFFVAGILLSAMQVQADPLGLTDPQRAMISIGQALCVGVLPFLPKLQSPPADTRVGKD